MDERVGNRGDRWTPVWMEGSMPGRLVGVWGVGDAGQWTEDGCVEGGWAGSTRVLAGWVESTGAFFSFLPRALLLSLPSLPQGT